MLNKAKTLKGYKLNCRDGEIGKVKEFYFDDHYWTIRYLVADTGDWLIGQASFDLPVCARLCKQRRALHLCRFDQKAD